MLLFMGLAEMVIGIPIIIAAVLANCTPTSIAMSTWITTHGLLGVLLALGFCIPQANREAKPLVRKIYYGLLFIGVGLGIAAAVHGGVGLRTGRYILNRIVYINSAPVRSIQVPPTYTTDIYAYPYDIFFGVYGGIFELLCLGVAFWSFFADYKKSNRQSTFATTPRSSFANLALAQEAVLKKRHSAVDFQSNPSLNRLHRIPTNPNTKF